MPFVSLPGAVRLYYERFNADSHLPLPASSSLPTPSDTPSSSRPSSSPSSSSSHASSTRPSILILAPAYLDSTFLKDYVEAFRQDYDVTTLELRSHGRSRNAANPSYDYFVAARDVAFVMESLALPPSHVYGPGCLAFQTALKLSLLFPELVLSLTLVGAPTLFAPPRAVAAFTEITNAWTCPADEDEWVDVIGGIGEFLLGEKKYEGADEAWDRVLGPIVRRYNPFKAREVWMASLPNHVNPKLSPELLATITVPVLFIHGDNDFCFGIDEVRHQSEAFTGSRDLEFHAVEGGPHLLSFTHASLVTSYMRPFLARNTPSPYPSLTSPSSLTALSIASKIAEDPKVALRNPHHPDSFSLLSNEEREYGRKKLEEMEGVERNCELVLPMCGEKDDWELGEDEEGEGDRRWTWSTRESYALPPLSPLSHPRSSLSNQGAGPSSGSRPLSTFSLQDSVVVQVESSEQTSETPEVGKAGGGLLQGLERRMPAVETSVSSTGSASGRGEKPLPSAPKGTTA
ncbi:hypothetical protein JCM8547_008133 [Rhodosporidiobolus lusitaniae]